MTQNHPDFARVFEALGQRRYFKLICGGSFSDTQRLQQLISIYAQAGVTAVDVSAALPVVDAAVETLRVIPQAPMLMVSFPLDADPHFRKIELVEDACIRCGLCVPVCPTRVFDLPPGESLQLDVPVCYGCGRCLPICPTEALVLDPFSVLPDLVTVLSKPEVQAVEIHTTYADPVMIDDLYRELGPYLENKLISICLRPQILPLEQATTFLNLLKSKSPYPIIIQVDGEPMSGSEDPEASRPALEAARLFADHLPQASFLTISGGVNAFTAKFLQESQYEVIQGVGMGTYARQKIWDSLADNMKALHIAESLVKIFQPHATSDIITV